MKRDFAWVYLLAAALAALAVLVRLYGWLVAGRERHAWEMIVPASFVVLLLIMWRGARLRRRGGGGNAS